ncbi:unnamed protein product [Rotaria sp. Silwood2]|nr:unnamed protein product [Rotaria sp. Silwood2]CAF2627161.1 unnamed protein product [Rotaria sp. Silwood2]CAF2994802.1 unnamed protein product [Rotaria sp. Silwood2]CAF4405794.1 unnamed protein product [Rotaria sp. Silwood2]CAF4435347.1 unnamed protein product [Rotaria sp. Silwood2]
MIHFALHRLDNSTKYTTQRNTKILAPSSSITRKICYDEQPCRHGIPLRVWLNEEKNLTIMACLCPPSFYGNRCQYQNQRISLTMQFQTISDSRRTLFAIIVSLIDDSDERIFHSY